MPNQIGMALERSWSRSGARKSAMVGKRGSQPSVAMNGLQGSSEGEAKAEDQVRSGLPASGGRSGCSATASTIDALFSLGVSWIPL
jgi:hypothetical protein